MAGQEPKAPSGKNNRKNQLVLIVDDNEAELLGINAFLEKFSYQTRTATGDKQAFAYATGLAPSLAIISLDLPGMNGFKLIRQLSARTATAHIPVIGIADRDNKDLKDRCLELGAAAFLGRPFEAEVLFNAVQAALENNPRSCMRVRTVLPVKVHGGDLEAFYGAYALTLSVGGMFLRTMSPVAVHSGISLEFNLNGRPIAADTTVLYNCQKGCGPKMETGVGLRFIDISRKDKDVINEFIKGEVTKDLV